MKWFKHLVDSGDDPDIGAIVNRFGPRGYYLFFRTLEIMAREFSIHHPGRNTFQIQWLLQRYSCQTGKKVLTNFFRFTNKLGRIRCRINRDTVFLNCPKLKDLADEYTLKQLKDVGIGVGSKSEKNPVQKQKENKNKKKNKNNIKEKDVFVDEFNDFWNAYDYKIHKQDTLKAYKTLRQKESKKTIAQALNGYGDYLKHRRIKENFEQRKMYPATFLREDRWRDFIDFEFKPGL